VTLAQATDVAQLPIPDIAWSAFAPELPPTAAALILLLVAVAGHRRLLLVGVPTAVITLALGVWLIVQDLVVPGAVAVGFAFAVPAAIAVVPRRPTLIGAWVAAASLAGALVLTLWQFVELNAGGGATIVPQEALAGAIANDGIAFFTRITVYVTALHRHPDRLRLPARTGRINRAEVEPLLLLVGGRHGGARHVANDLITLFMAVEVLSLALYVLAGLARRDRRSQEASLKYFILGCGRLGDPALRHGADLRGRRDPESSPGIGSAPWGWSPRDRTGRGRPRHGPDHRRGRLQGRARALPPVDARRLPGGSPTNVTAFMAAATKAAGFAAVLRLFLVAFPPMQSLWVPVLSALAALTMLYGAYLAVVQRVTSSACWRTRRSPTPGTRPSAWWRYSNAGLSGTLWYLLTYAVSTLGCLRLHHRGRADAPGGGRV
jgi:NADH-quinone oxidoreductase subunit N